MKTPTTSFGSSIQKVLISLRYPRLTFKMLFILLTLALENALGFSLLSRFYLLCVALDLTIYRLPTERSEGLCCFRFQPLFLLLMYLFYVFYAGFRYKYIFNILYHIFDKFAMPQMTQFIFFHEVFVAE